MYLNVIPTVFIKNKQATTLYNDQFQGILNTLQISFENSKDLLAIVTKTCEKLIGGGSDSPRTRFKLTDISSDTIKHKEYSSMDMMVDDVIRNFSKSEVMLQPQIRTSQFIRGFYIPPSSKLFKCKFEQTADGEYIKNVTFMKPGLFPVLEDHCKQMFTILNVIFFEPRNLKLEGIGFDFIENDNITYFTGINSFKSSILDPNCIFIEEQKNNVPAKRCYGIFCQCTVPLDGIVSLIKSIRKCDTAKGNYTLLYKDISDYDRIYKIMCRNYPPMLSDLIKPYLYDLPKNIPSMSNFDENMSPMNESKRSLESSRSTSELPPKFQPAPVCEICYYMYLLYKSKQEKMKVPNFVMKKTVFFGELTIIFE